MKKLNIIASCCMIAVLLMGTMCKTENTEKKVADTSHWVGTWGTAVQLTEPHNNPPQPGISGNTLRQKIRVSIGGDSLRLKLSNEFGNEPIKIKSVNIAPALEGSKVDTTAFTDILFGGKSNLEIAVGQSVISDITAFSLEPRMDLAITIAFEYVPSNITGHPGSRTTSYILKGDNAVRNAEMSGAVTTDHWYVIERIDVKAPENSAAIAIVGNSITDGRGSTTNKVNRWADVFAERLQANPATSNLGVLNMGIGGNCVVRGGLGPAASVRFCRDVIDQPGIKYVIIFEGVNDIGGSSNVKKTEQELISAFTQMIDTARNCGLTVYGATVTPFKESFYYTPEKEACRIAVNNWIRTCSKFDAVIDLEKAICSPSDTTIMNDGWHDNDHLHPNAEGHKQMGSYIDLTLFE